MTTYRVKNILGQAMITPDLKIALWHYCYGRRCYECQLVKDAVAGKPCHQCEEAELLRRLGNEIEVIHDYPAQSGTSSAVSPKAENDLVNHPSHYTSGGIECIDAIEAALSSQTDPTNAFLTGQAIKYLWRWPLKGGLEDLRKAKWYLDRLIGKVEG